jgi:HEAT repeat protein
MMTGDQKTELKVSIKKREAEKILNNYLIDKVPYPEDCAKAWLEDLLKYHLLQVETNDYIAFRHQMIQEYYAAEELLERLPELSDQEFQRNYLNYLKWTEVIGLMLGLVEKEIQAIHIVDLAREVDLQLAAKLSGKVLPVFQKKTVEWVTMLEIGARLKLKLISLANSEATIPTLIKFIEDQDEYVSRSALDLLVVLGTEHIIPGLLKALADPHAHIRRDSINTLASMGKEAVVPALIQALRHQDDYVCWKAARSLVAIGTKDAIAALEQALDDKDSYVRWNVAESLAMIGIDSAKTILQKELHTYPVLEQPSYLKILPTPSSEGEINNRENGFPSKATETSIDLVFTEEKTPKEVLETKENVFDMEFELCSLKSKDLETRKRAYKALTKSSDNRKNSRLIEIVEDHDNDFGWRWEVALILIDIGSEASLIYCLLNALSIEESRIQFESTILLTLFLPQLNDLLFFIHKDESIEISFHDVIGCISERLKSPELKKDPSKDRITKALTVAASSLVLRCFRKGKKETKKTALEVMSVMIHSKESRWIFLLVEAINDEDNDICKIALESLGKIDSEEFEKSIVSMTEVFNQKDNSIPERMNRIDSEKSIVSFDEYLERSEAKKEIILFLNKIGTEESIASLKKTIKGANNSIYTGVVRVLSMSTISSGELIYFLLEILKSVSDNFLGEITKILRIINSDLTISYLIKALNHESSDIRSIAARMLGSIGSEQSVPYLIKALKCNENDVRVKVVEALAKIGSDETIPFLVQALKDQDRGVYLAVAQYLEEESSPQSLKKLWQIQVQVPETKILKVITAIQERLQYYNHELVATLAYSSKCLPITKTYMKQKTVIRLVVASPGDVRPERDLLADSVIPELNQGIADDRNVVLELVRWETDAYPGFHLDGPQALIDDILQIQNCDILIGIFWKRFGTPTQDGTTGTEHEFLTAYKAWHEKGQPQIMMYFNQKPYTPQSSKEIQQSQKVLEFRENLPKEGLYWKYEDEAEFESLIRQHLSRVIKRLSQQNA